MTATAFFVVRLVTVAIKNLQKSKKIEISFKVIHQSPSIVKVQRVYVHIQVESLNEL